MTTVMLDADAIIVHGRQFPRMVRNARRDGYRLISFLFP